MDGIKRPPPVEAGVREEGGAAQLARVTQLQERPLARFDLGVVDWIHDP